MSKNEQHHFVTKTTKFLKILVALLDCVTWGGYIFQLNDFMMILEEEIFRHARVSSTYPCQSVRWSHFRISNLSASLVALGEKLKREDPNYFCVFSESVFSKGVFL